MKLNIYINKISKNLSGAFGRTTRPSSAELYCAAESSGDFVYLPRYERL